MKSPLLLGAVREPSTAVAQQIVAWDDADLTLIIASAIARSGKKLLPSEVRDALAAATTKVKQKLGEANEPVTRFCEPMDAQLMKLCRLLDHVGLKIENVPGPTLLDDAARRLEGEIIRRLKAQDLPQRKWLQPSARRHEEFSGTTIEAAARHIMETLFAETEQQLHDLDEPARQHAAERIIEAVEGLDPAAQAEIRERLQIDKLDVSAILAPGALISIGGIGAAAGMGGFAAYTFVTATVASVAGAIGVTVPFHAYILASSALAFLANPLTIGATLLGGAWLLRSRLNASVRDRWTLLLVAFAVVAQGHASDGSDPDARFVAQARMRYSEYLSAPRHERRAYEQAFPAFRRPIAT